MYRALTTVLLAALALLCAPLLSLGTVSHLVGHALEGESAAPPSVTAGWGSVATVGPSFDSGALNLTAGKSGGDPRVVPRDLPEGRVPDPVETPPSSDAWELVRLETAIVLPSADLAPTPVGRAPPVTALL